MADAPITIACGNYDRTKAVSTAASRSKAARPLICRCIRRRYSTGYSAIRNSSVSAMSFSSYISLASSWRRGYVRPCARPPVRIVFGLSMIA